MATPTFPVELWTKIFTTTLRRPDCVLLNSDACQDRRCSTVKMFELERAKLAGVSRLFYSVVEGCDLAYTHMFVHKESAARLLTSEAVVRMAGRVLSVRMDLSGMQIDAVLGWVIAMKKFVNLRRIEIRGSVGEGIHAGAVHLLLGGVLDGIMGQEASQLTSVFCDLPINVVGGLRGRGTRRAASISTEAAAPELGDVKVWSGTTMLYVDVPFTDDWPTAVAQHLEEDEYPDLVNLEVQLEMSSAVVRPFFEKVASSVVHLCVKQNGLVRPHALPPMENMVSIRCYMGSARLLLDNEQISLSRIVLVGFSSDFFTNLGKRYRFAMDLDDELASITERNWFPALSVIELEGLRKADFKRHRWMQQELLVYRGWWSICVEEGIRLLGGDGLELFDEESFADVQLLEMEPHELYAIADGFVEYV